MAKHKKKKNTLGTVTEIQNPAASTGTMHVFVRETERRAACGLRRCSNETKQIPRREGLAGAVALRGARMRS